MGFNRIVAITLFILLSSCNLAALSKSLPPMAQQDLQGIVQTIRNAPVGQRYQVYQKSQRMLNRLTTSIPGLKLFLYLMSTLHYSQQAVQQLQDSVRALETNQQITNSELQGITAELLEVMQLLQVNMPKQSLNLQRTAQAIEKLIQLDPNFNSYIDLHLTEQNPSLYNFIKLLSQHAAHTKTQALLQEEEQTSREAFLKRLNKMIPRKQVTALKEPVQRFYQNLIEYNQQVWNITLSVINLLSNAAQSARHINQAKLEQITAQLQLLINNQPEKASPVSVLTVMSQHFPYLNGLIRLFRSL